MKYSAHKWNIRKKYRIEKYNIIAFGNYFFYNNNKINSIITF